MSTREEINQRFIEAYNYLISIGEIQKNNQSNNKSIKVFAQKVFKNSSVAHLIPAYLRGERCVPVKHLPNLQNEYSISLNWMLTGIGEMINDMIHSEKILKERKEKVLKEIATSQNNIFQYWKQLEEIKTTIIHNQKSEHEEVIQITEASV